MSVMAHGSVNSAHQAILGVLRSRGAMTPNELVTAVVGSKTDLSDVDVKRVVWHMIADHQLELSADQLLVLPALSKQSQHTVDTGEQRLESR